MASVKSLTGKIVKFRDARDWKQFHTPKDMILSLMLETAELAEHFQWKNAEELETHLANKRAELGDELADVLYWVLLIAHDLNIDIVQAFRSKMRKNERKYPVEKSLGSSRKYSRR